MLSRPLRASSLSMSSHWPRKYATHRVAFSLGIFPYLPGLLASAVRLARGAAFCLQSAGRATGWKASLLLLEAPERMDSEQRPSPPAAGPPLIPRLLEALTAVVCRFPHFVVGAAIATALTGLAFAATRLEYRTQR